jgi:uncharacterized repeat protein (TIGR01451 family)
MTYWVGASGNDANTGLSYAQRKATWTAVLDLATAKGDVVNVAAGDGALTVTNADAYTLSNRNGGTSESDPGLTIQGVDSAGDPAVAELRFQDDTTAASMLRIDNGGATDPAYIILQGLYVNWTAMSSTVHSKVFVVRANGSTDNHIILQACKFAQAQFQGGQVAKDHALLITDGGYSFEVRYCYFLNMDANGSSSYMVSLHHRGQGDIHHNVVIQNGAYAPGDQFLLLGSNDGNATDHREYNNTYLTYSTAGGAFQAWNSVDATGSTGGNATKHLHSNVHADFRASGSASYAKGAAVASTTYDRTIGYTLFCNPNSLAYANSGPYQRPWDPDDSDSPEGTSIWATDVSTTSDVFNGKSTPWDWENINGTGYTLTLVGDLRIKDTSNWRTMALGGGVPGAIPDSVAAGPSLSIDKAHLGGNFQVGETGQFSFTVRNVGDTTATGTLTLVDTLPAGLSYRAASGSGWVVSVSSNNTITATWAGDVVAGDVTLPLIIDVDVAETARPSATNTVEVSSADAGTATDTDIVSVDAAASTFVPGNPVSTLISEAAPGFPVISASLHVRRNLELEIRQDSVGEDTGLGRLFSGLVDLPAGATDVELPMILEPTFVMLETDQALVVQINSMTFALLAGGCIALTEAAQINTFAVTNQSAFKVAHLQYCGAAAVTQGTVEDPRGGRGDDEELN